MSERPYSYRTIEKESESILKEKGSKFLGYARSVFTKDDVETFLTDIISLHPKARHHCYAWRIGHPDIEERSNDDGEPSGTAGRPIMGQIVKENLTNTMLIVVRYFGGTLLGTSGLIQAYKSCAESTLKNANIIRVIEKEIWLVELHFAIVHVLEEWAPKSGFEILHRQHKDGRMIYKLEISKSKSSPGRKELIAKLQEAYPEEIDLQKKKYDQFTITQSKNGKEH